MLYNFRDAKIGKKSIAIGRVGLIITKNEKDYQFLDSLLSPVGDSNP